MSTQLPKHASHNSNTSHSSHKLEVKLEKEGHKLEHLSLFKQNIIFLKKIRHFREEIYTWVVELCKEDNKKDYDRMA